MYAFSPQTSDPQVLRLPGPQIHRSPAQANTLFLLHIHVCLQSTGPQVHRSTGPQHRPPSYSYFIYMYAFSPQTSGPQVLSSSGPQVLRSTGPQVHRSTSPQVHSSTAQATNLFLLHIHVCLQSTDLTSTDPQVHSTGQHIILTSYTCMPSVHRSSGSQVHRSPAQANTLFLLHIHVCLQSTGPQVHRSTGPQHRPTHYSYFIYMYAFSPQVLRFTGPQHGPTSYSYFIYMYALSPQTSGP